MGSGEVCKEAHPLPAAQRQLRLHSLLVEQSVRKLNRSTSSLSLAVQSQRDFHAASDRQGGTSCPGTVAVCRRLIVHRHGVFRRLEVLAEPAAYHQCPFKEDTF